MAAAYRYDWGSRFDDQAGAGFDPLSFTTLAAHDASPHATLYRGEFRAADGYRLPYRLWLPPSPRGTLLLLHGACDYAGAFETIGPAFAKRGYAALAFDQRGFGQTRSRNKWAGTRRLAADIGAAISFVERRVPGAPIFVVGESMGAALSVLAAARHHINGVAGLVLVAPGALGCSVRRWAYGVVARALLALGARADLFIERVRCDELSSDAAIRLLADPLIVRRITPSLVAGLVKLGSQAYDLAPEVGIPTLTLVGSHEDVSPLHCIRGLHRRLPGDATLQEFEGGPHLLLHWRERARVLDAIAAWIDARVSPIQVATGELEIANVGLEGDVEKVPQHRDRADKEVDQHVCVHS
jgi:acylglycerol lipase